MPPISSRSPKLPSAAIGLASGRTNDITSTPSEADHVRPSAAVRLRSALYLPGPADLGTATSTQIASLPPGGTLNVGAGLADASISASGSYVPSVRGSIRQARMAEAGMRMPTPVSRSAQSILTSRTPPAPPSRTIWKLTVSLAPAISEMFLFSGS